jgi:hypothetical protein
MLIPTLTDHFRQDLFELRRDLFCYMAKGHVQADEPAYVHLRRSMNGMIRYTEHVTFCRVIVTAASQRNPGEAHRIMMDKAIARIGSEEVRDVLSGYRWKLSNVIIWHFLRTSPAVWLLMIPLLAFAGARAIMHGLSKKTFGLFRRIIGEHLRRRLPLEGIQAEAEELDEGEMVTV